MSQFKIISPIDLSVFAERNYASKNTIEDTLVKSTEAQKAWKETPLEKRIAYCEDALRYLDQHAEELAKELTAMMGRPIRYSPFEIKGGFQERARHMLSIAAESLAEIEISEKEGFRRYIKKEPLGTVLILSPWNYPYLTSVNALVPALLSGNTVILKHADQTALVAERYQEAFQAAGLPEGVFQYLHLTHSQVAEVISDLRIDHVAFTGSVDGGKAIQNTANQRFINTGLELGGKDPAYVCEDADLRFSAENLVDGSFFNSGQSCCGIERIYVHEKVYDRFINFFAQITVHYTLGDPRNPEVTLGPVVRETNALRIQEQVDQAVAMGARTLIDKSSFPGHLGPHYMAPQILVDVDHRMDIMKEETFGPVVGIMKVSGDEEAIQLMNDSKYGLTASIWTKDPEKAVTLGNQIETGTFFMNRCDYLDPELAWTGVKDSGKGHTLSALGFDQFVRPKSYHLRLS